MKKQTKKAKTQTMLVNFVLDKEEAVRKMGDGNIERISNRMPVYNCPECGRLYSGKPPHGCQPRCKDCECQHNPIPDGFYLDFKGWRFTAPFICGGCGIEICFKKWMSSGTCKQCDVDNSKNVRAPWCKMFSGPRTLVDKNAAQFISENSFLEPKDRDIYYPKDRWPYLR